MIFWLQSMVMAAAVSTTVAVPSAAVAMSTTPKGMVSAAAEAATVGFGHFGSFVVRLFEAAASEAIGVAVPAEGMESAMR